MQTVPLSVSARPQNQSARQMRREKLVPLNVYGNLDANLSLACHHNDLMRAYLAAGESTLVDLETDGKKIPVLFKAIQMDPVTDDLTHVDFYAVNMKEEIEARVSLHVEEGDEAPAVKEGKGVLLHIHDEVTVTCLPSKLPHNFPISLENLKEIDDTITVADLKVPEGVTISEEPDTVLLIVQEQRKQEEEEPAPAAEGAEGEAATGEGEKKEGEGSDADKKED